MNVIELCAGAGGQAIGLEQAGFEAQALIEIDAAACSTLRLNRPAWNVVEGDVKSFTASAYKGIELVAGGVPCPPFSVAGKQLGAEDERDLFPEAIRIVDETRPHAVMLENVRGFLDPVFKEYREQLSRRLKSLGYVTQFKLLHASAYGVSQLRPRVIIVALRSEFAEDFSWPLSFSQAPPSVGMLLGDLMAANMWERADDWSLQANRIAPTIVGGSKKHGGPDLGPTRAKKAWAELHVDGHGIATDAPLPGFIGMPRLTTRMVARIQGFPDTWRFYGKKTAAYRQIGNALPAPVARAVAQQIRQCLQARRRVFAVIEVPARVVI
jgi:DNA (cytosine-5)-methyltransferase 1